MMEQLGWGLDWLGRARGLAGRQERGWEGLRTRGGWSTIHDKAGIRVLGRWRVQAGGAPAGTRGF